MPEDETEAISEASNEETLPSVYGVNTDIGRMHCGGSTALYINVLASFCRDADEKAIRIEKCVQDGDFRLYTTLVHGIRGSAAGIGAGDMKDFAERLETAGNEKDAIVILNQTASFIESLKALVMRIRAALNIAIYEESAEKVGIPSLRIETLKCALQDMDIRAVNMLLTEYAAMPLDAETRALVSELEQQILMFEYDAAIEIIDAVL
jgi:HPt (histidine-containing phosphotransfer) domain-containing protein